MEYSLNLDGEVSNDIGERMPGRENKEEYSNCFYHLTFDDAGMDREVFRRVFEEFDQREEFNFNGENPVNALNNNAEYIDDSPTDWLSYNSGGEAVIEAEMPGVTGLIWAPYGPSEALRDDAVFSAYAEMGVDLCGDIIVDSVKSITEQTEAPYLESDPEEVFYEKDSGFIITGGFDVPTTYNEEDLEESVDAWVDRLSQVSEIQQDLKEVMDKYS